MIFKDKASQEPDLLTNMSANRKLLLCRIPALHLHGHDGGGGPGGGGRRWGAKLAPRETEGVRFLS